MASKAPRRGAEGAGAFVAEEVVLGHDVVDLKAVGAGVALADVALEEVLACDEIRPLAVVARCPTVGRRRQD